MSFADANNGIAVGDIGIILHTANAGETCVEQDSGTEERLHAVSFVDASTGMVVGNRGTILRTENGGVTWVAQDSGTVVALCGVSFADADTGVAVGSPNFTTLPRKGPTFRTTDGARPGRRRTG